MKKILLFVLATSSLAYADIPPKGLTIFDQVASVVYQGNTPDLGSKEDLDTNKIVIITQQDIERRGFDGNDHTLSSLEEENLLWQKADQLKMSLSKEDVDKQLDKMGMPKEQQEFIAEKWNYADVDEFKDALQKMYAANMYMGFETESGLVIPEVEVQSYYDNNPVWLDANYEIQTAFVSAKNEKQKKVLQKKLDKLIVHGRGYKVAWSDPITIEEHEISAKNKFLTNLKTGNIYAKSVDGGFDVFKMVKATPRRLQPLAKRKSEIVGVLRSERYPKVIAEVKKGLRINSSIYHPKQF